MLATENLALSHQAVLPTPLLLNTSLPPIGAPLRSELPQLKAAQGTPTNTPELWQLHSPVSGVPVNLLLTLNARTYRNYDPIAPVRHALTLVVGLSEDLEHEAPTLPDHFETYSKAASFIRDQAHVLFAQPPCSDDDFLQACRQQVKLRQELLGPVAANWHAQLSPEARTRLERNPAAHLFLLTHLQWQLKLKERSHKRPLCALGTDQAPWSLHAGLGLPLLSKAEAQGSSPLVTSHVVRVNLKALTNCYQRLEHSLQQLEPELLPQPIVTGISRAANGNNLDVLDFQFPEPMIADLKNFHHCLTKLSAELELSSTHFFTEPWPIATDRAWSSALISKRRLMQCYDMCLSLFSLRYPCSAIAHRVQHTVIALEQNGLRFVRLHPEVTFDDAADRNKPCLKRVLGTLIPAPVLDLLALSSYVHALDRKDALVRDTPFTYERGSWQDSMFYL